MDWTTRVDAHSQKPRTIPTRASSRSWLSMSRPRGADAARMKKLRGARNRPRSAGAPTRNATPVARLSVVPPPATSGSRFAGLAQDIRYAVRLLRREPRHPLTITTMALGIGATTVLFSVSCGSADETVPCRTPIGSSSEGETRGGSSPRFGDFTNTAYLAWREKRRRRNIGAWSLRS